MVIKNLENKIKLVTIFCGFFLAGCVLISLSSIWTARVMVTDAQQKVYVLDGNVPILVQCSTTSFSRWHRMTNIYATPWIRRCTWWTRPDWHSTIH